MMKSLIVSKCSFISGYILKNMLRVGVGCGQVSQNLPYFDLRVAYVRIKGYIIYINIIISSHYHYIISDYLDTIMRVI